MLPLLPEGSLHNKGNEDTHTCTMISRKTRRAGILSTTGGFRRTDVVTIFVLDGLKTYAFANHSSWSNGTSHRLRCCQCSTVKTLYMPIGEVARSFKFANIVTLHQRQGPSGR